MIRASWRAFTLLMPLVGAAARAAAAAELGAEFQVNTYTTGPQRAPSVAGRADGSFVVTWQSGSSYDYQHAPGDSESGIFLQRFDASGATVGDELHVNSFTISQQQHPVVSMGGDGAFVVVWESGCAYGTVECTQDGSRRAVALQRFDVEGARVGSELVVNTQTLGSQYYPAVASAPTGEFVVTWASALIGNPFPDLNQVPARRFAADGQPAGDEFQVDTSTTGYDSAPVVAVDSSGNFVVVWVRSEPGGGPFKIHGRRFDATGAPLGEFVVADATAYGSLQPSITSIGAGEFVVAWEAYYYHYAFPEHRRGGEIRARHVSIDGTLGAVFAVNSYVPGYQFFPQVGSDTAGNFVIAWTSDSYGGDYGQDGDDGGIFAQAFAPDGAPLGSEFQVNVFTTGHQNDSAVAATGPGEFVVVWTSTPYGYGGGLPQDGDRAGVFGRSVGLSKCDGSVDCDDANPCTSDACEGGVCLNRRQPACCQIPAECFDGDPCTDDVCTGTSCSHPPIVPCAPCARNLIC